MEKTRILGISGSTRDQGNTTFLVQMALDACKAKGAEVELIELAHKELLYCDYCNACTEKHNYTCPKDDDVAGILLAMKAADGIVVGSPTYFASVSGKLKTLFDRTLPLRRDGFRLSKKAGGAIAVGGSRNGGQENVIRDIHNWMLVHEMIVVSDQKTAHFGGIAVARNIGDAAKDETGIATAENLGLQVLEVASRLRSRT